MRASGTPGVDADKKQRKMRFAWLAADVVYDKKLNPVVVDVNSAPSFYHERPDQPWPRWFVEERSLMTRAAGDLLHLVALLKLENLDHRESQGSDPARADARSDPMKSLPREKGGWELVFNELEDQHEAAAGAGSRRSST